MTTLVSILGSTGSIGTQTLEVIQQYPERFKIDALSAGKNLKRLAEQIQQFNPNRVCIQNPSDQAILKNLLKAANIDFSGDILSGEEGLVQLASETSAELVVVGLVGLAGLKPSLEALKQGKKLLTANKETFVAAGHLVQPYLSQIIPVDSEHSAIFQCLHQENPKSIHKLYLTASGGPFRDTPLSEFSTITPQRALKHPNWVMGSKVTIDSATMMNKGLEIIEAHWLFGVDYSQIDVVVHRQSIIHSGVGFVDGSILFQAGISDMRIPILYALGYPERLPCPFDGHLNPATLGQLNFEAPDLNRFPCIALAYEAGRLGGTATTVLNAADEVAVDLFLNGHIGFREIPRLLESTLKQHQTEGISQQPNLSEIEAIDQWARAYVSTNAQTPPVSSVF